MRTAPRTKWVGLAVALLALAAGAWQWRRQKTQPQGRFILISLDTLRADRLGAYGYGKPTSPFLDSLAARATLFENAVVQLPGTLPSHMSIFTGLYPAEHGVYPPEGALSPLVPTLPEVLRSHGFRTGGHAEGGYVQGGYGFARGFEEWAEESPVVERAGVMVKPTEVVQRTFRRGLDFLRRVKNKRSFFLFLHTYSIHDPYEPPPEYRARFWPGPPPPGAFPPQGGELVAFNAGQRTMAPGALEYYQALYDAQIAYTDDVLRDFFAGLAELGLEESVTVVITSDHGEEFLEHGRLAHEQVYHECLHVPLIVKLPGQRTGRRVSALVESVDIAPTLYELARVPAWSRPRYSGRSLAAALRPGGELAPRDAYAEAFVTGDRALYRRTEEGLFQYVRREPRQTEDGVWITGAISFETFAPALEFFAQSYHEPRPLQIRVDGTVLRTEPLQPVPRLLRIALPRSAGKRVVELSSPTCDSPALLKESGDTRCLSFLIRGLSASRSELYHLTRDPRGAADLSHARAETAAEMAARLDARRFRAVAEPGRSPLDPEQEKRLRALGYIH